MTRTHLWRHRESSLKKKKQILLAINRTTPTAPTYSSHYDQSPFLLLFNCDCKWHTRAKVVHSDIDWRMFRSTPIAYSLLTHWLLLYHMFFINFFPSVPYDLFNIPRNDQFQFSQFSYKKFMKNAELSAND